MDSKELLIRLAREGFNPLSYRIETVDGGEGQDECYCLRRSGSSWEVCYLERGASRTLGTFASETGACDDFFTRLDKEPSTRSYLLTWFPERSKADDFVTILLRAGINQTHRDAPAFADRHDIRYRVFVDGRDLERARRIRDSIPGAEAG
jgi:hypothetical protein